MTSTLTNKLTDHVNNHAQKNKNCTITHIHNKP